MAAYGSQAVNKRQKTTTKEAGRNIDFNEFFPGINRIEYKPDAPAEETLCFRYYNSMERIHGRTMEEWLRPSVSFCHSFCSSGCNVQTYSGDIHKLLDEEIRTQENYKKRLRAAFEFYYKLGVKFWSLEDGNIAAKGSSWDEMCQNMDDSANLILELQLHTGIKPLWITCDSSHARFRQGGFTNPEANSVGMAAAQVKKGMELAQRLGAECFLIRDNNEGYNCVLNTDMSRELRHYSRLLKITADYKERLNYRGQLLFQSQSEKNGSGALAHSYAPNALAALCLLRHYGLERHYKLNVVPSDEVFLTSAYGTLGCLDITHFSHRQDLANATLLMKNVIEQGGLQPGGMNIGIHNIKGMLDMKDMFAAYVNIIDLYALGFRKASKLISDGLFAKNLQQRYLSFHTGFGSRLISGEADLEDCEDHIRRLPLDVMVTPGQAEYWQAIFSHYLFNKNG